jgi:hypothetical protein
MTDEIRLPVEWVVNGDTSSGYATNMIVQHTNHEFIISFFEIKPPLLIGEESEQRQQAAILGGIKAQCIAQITVHADRMPQFLQALNTNYEQFLENRSDAEDEL